MRHIVRPTVFDAWPVVATAMSLRAADQGDLGFNMSLAVGDRREQVEANRASLARWLAFDPDALLVQRQVHRCDIVHAHRGDHPTEADAQFTTQAGLLLGISIADCVPVLLYEPTSGIVGGIHAGWRGTVNGVVSKSLAYMTEDAGLDVSGVRCYVGASAGPCCYEVGEDVAGLFSDKRRRAIGDGKYLVDNRGSVVDQLLLGGVLAENIEINHDCSICDASYHSHRRSNGAGGRALAVIGLRWSGS